MRFNPCESIQTQITSLHQCFIVTSKILGMANKKKTKLLVLDNLSNDLSYLINRMTHQKIFAHITLEKGERSYLTDLASDLL